MSHAKKYYEKLDSNPTSKRALQTDPSRLLSVLKSNTRAHFELKHLVISDYNLLSTPYFDIQI